MFVGLLFLSFISNVQTSEIFSTSDGAVQGYCVVAYFTESKPMKGKKEFTANLAGENWYFASAENLNTFKVSPEKYVPQFGGYRAYRMSRGYKAKTDPEA